MAISNLELIILILLGWMEVCLAVKCYVCYDGDPREPTMQKVLQAYSDVLVDLPNSEFCRDPFNDKTEKYLDKENCDMCGKIKVEANDKVYIARTCYNDCRGSEGSQSGVDFKIACCRKSTCNTATRNGPTTVFLLLLPALVYLFAPFREIAHV